MRGPWRARFPLQVIIGTSPVEAETVAQAGPEGVVLTTTIAARALTITTTYLGDGRGPTLVDVLEHMPQARSRAGARPNAISSASIRGCAPVSPLAGHPPPLVLLAALTPAGFAPMLLNFGADLARLERLPPSMGERPVPLPCRSRKAAVPPPSTITCCGSDGRG